MRVLIKNGLVVNADGQLKQDLLIEDGLVKRLPVLLRQNNPAK